MVANRKLATITLLMVLTYGVIWVLSKLPDEKGGSGDYEVVSGCVLVSSRSNDGDSFKVKTPAGEEIHVRLYYVDTPETKLVTYSDGNTSAKRLGHQAEYFGGLSQQETLRIGQEAQSWTKKVLRASKTFELSTRREQVYKSGRVYGLVKLQHNGEDRWLHELLVEQGIARIYTEGSDLPDGTKLNKQKQKLKKLERAAKAARKGAWGLAS